MRLFVDCDDTLILYNQTGVNPYGLMCGTPYIVNEGLAEYVRAFAEENPDALIVFWSGAGGAYAKECARLAGLKDVKAAYLDKNRDTLTLVGEDDIVFDDQQIDVPAPVREPFDWLILGRGMVIREEKADDRGA